MGGVVSSVFWPVLDRLLLGSNREFRILMLGLDAAGKTTLLYRLKLGEVQTTVPTIGFNVERVDYQSISFLVWDVGGQDKLRMLWRHYYRDTDALIFVIDSADTQRIELARKELTRLAQAEEMENAVVLIFANKQDLPGALDAKSIADKLQLSQLLGNNPWYIQPCVATEGSGLYEGLDWLSTTLRDRTLRS